MPNRPDRNAVATIKSPRAMISSGAIRISNLRCAIGVPRLCPRRKLSYLGQASAFLMVNRGAGVAAASVSQRHQGIRGGGARRQFRGGGKRAQRLGGGDQP